MKKWFDLLVDIASSSWCDVQLSASFSVSCASFQIYHLLFLVIVQNWGIGRCDSSAHRDKHALHDGENSFAT